MKKLLALILSVLLFTTSFAFASETTLVDNADITFRIKSFSVDWLWGATMSVYIENKTDKTVMFSIDNCVVDGYANDPFWAKELMPGSKANVDIRWSDYEEIPTLLSFELRAYDSNDWMADDLYNGQHVVYPQGENAVQIEEYQLQPTDVVLVDNDQLSIIFRGTHNDAIWGYTADLYLHNKTDKNLMFSVQNASLNGYMMDPYWACEVPANARAMEDISWMNSELEANDITAVESIVLALRVYDSDDWFADDYFAGTVQINP